MLPHALAILGLGHGFVPELQVDRIEQSLLLKARKMREVLLRWPCIQNPIRHHGNATIGWPFPHPFAAEGLRFYERAGRRTSHGSADRLDLLATLCRVSRPSQPRGRTAERRSTAPRRSVLSVPAGRSSAS